LLLLRWPGRWLDQPWGGVGAACTGGGTPLPDLLHVFCGRGAPQSPANQDPGCPPCALLPAASVRVSAFAAMSRLAQRMDGGEAEAMLATAAKVGGPRRRRPRRRPSLRHRAWLPPAGASPDPPWGASSAASLQPAALLVPGCTPPRPAA
jgi:hypothetical protein